MPPQHDQPAGGPADDPVDVLAALGEPARRALYDYVVAQSRPVSRDEAADAVGMKRATAAFHLDRLAEGGLLDVEFRRLTGRSGPGAGRPAKLYTRADREFEITLPPRRYALVGELLATVIDSIHESQSTQVADETDKGDLNGHEHEIPAEYDGRSEPDVDAISAAVAHEAGRALAADDGDLNELLSAAGYEPRNADDGSIVLANCPFHDLAQRHTRLVCGMNLHLLTGVLEGLGSDHRAVLDPDESRCCVRIDPANRSGGLDGLTQQWDTQQQPGDR